MYLSCSLLRLLIPKNLPLYTGLSVLSLRICHQTVNCCICNCCSNIAMGEFLLCCLSDYQAGIEGFKIYIVNYRQRASFTYFLPCLEYKSSCFVNRSDHISFRIWYLNFRVQKWKPRLRCARAFCWTLEYATVMAFLKPWKCLVKNYMKFTDTQVACMAHHTYKPMGSFYADEFEPCAMSYPINAWGAKSNLLLCTPQNSSTFLPNLAHGSL